MAIVRQPAGSDCAAQTQWVERRQLRDVKLARLLHRSAASASAKPRRAASEGNGKVSAGRRTWLEGEGQANTRAHADSLGSPGQPEVCTFT
jgi:hypothetical protein